MTERAKKLLWLYYKQSRKIRRVSGLPPLTFKAKKAGTLKNYRIYGNTVNGENVGDRTANLIQGSIKNANIGNNGKINTSNEFILVYAPVVTGESYTISNNNGTNVYAFYNVVPSTETETSYDNNRQIFSTSTITVVPPTTGYIAVRLANTAQDIMINPGSTAVPYEPVGYRVPVTVNDVTTDLYLPEPIKMVGDEAEYIDYAEQKMHRIGADDIDVTLPALPVLPGTNTLTVGTEVQPSGVEIKGRIKAAGGD